MSKLNILNDGILFINVYSKGQTTLGQNLSNFAHTPFTHPSLGNFNSIEGAFYYFLTGKIHEQLRLLSGGAAKKEGRRVIPKEWLEESTPISDRFKQFILECIQCKLRTHKQILMQLISTDLPLEHFYVQGEHIVNKEEYRWILDEIDRIRTVTKEWYINKYGALPNIPLKNS